jgi:hypothetical protein
MSTTHVSNEVHLQAVLAADAQARVKAASIIGAAGARLA